MKKLAYLSKLIISLSLSGMLVTTSIYGAINNSGIQYKIEQVVSRFINADSFQEIKLILKDDSTSNVALMFKDKTYIPLNAFRTLPVGNFGVAKDVKYRTELKDGERILSINIRWEDENSNDYMTLDVNGDYLSFRRRYKGNLISSDNIPIASINAFILNKKGFNYIPISVLRDNLKMTVYWDYANKTVTIPGSLYEGENQPEQYTKVQEISTEETTDNKNTEVTLDKESLIETSTEDNTDTKVDDLIEIFKTLAKNYRSDEDINDDERKLLLNKVKLIMHDMTKEQVQEFISKCPISEIQASKEVAKVAYRYMVKLTKYVSADVINIKNEINTYLTQLAFIKRYAEAKYNIQNDYGVNFSTYYDLIEDDEYNEDVKEGDAIEHSIYELYALIPNGIDKAKYRNILYDFKEECEKTDLDDENAVSKFISDMLNFLSEM